MNRHQRLLIVLPHLGIGGAQRVAVNLANYWVQQGHVVKLVTTLEHKVDFYHLDGRIERLVLEKPRGPLLTLQAVSFSPLAIVERHLQDQLGFLHAAQRLSPAAARSPRGRFRTAASSYIMARQPLQQSINVILSVPRRVWKGAYPSGVRPRLSGLGHVLLLSGLLLVRTARISTRGLKGVVRHSQKSASQYAKRAATKCLTYAQLAKRPTFLTRFLRMSMWRVGALRETIQAMQPDVVLSFLSSTNIITVAAGYGLPYRLVISERNDPARQELQEPWQSLRPRAYPLADLITANSHGALHELENYCPTAKLAYVANPIAISEEPSGTGRTSSILFLARLVPQKAPDILVEAFAQFSRQHPEWSLEIAGDGPMEPELRKRVGALGLDRQVRFHGMVKDPTGLLARSRVFALPSRFEGTPNSLLEAMASGLACIVSDASPGPLKLVEHEKSGLVVRTDDPHALAEAFSRLADDSDFQLEMATAARERTREFLIDSVARQWETLLFPHDQNDPGEPSRA